MHAVRYELRVQCRATQLAPQPSCVGLTELAYTYSLSEAAMRLA
jgi:hypothetical protein